MAWNDTPKAFIFMSDTQPNMQENFESFKTAFAIDHYDINDVSFSGIHKKLDIIRQIIDEAKNTIDAKTIGFYDKTLNDKDQLYIKTATQTIPITYSSGNTRTLPSGIVMKTGLATVANMFTTTQFQSISFDTPFTSIPYAIFLGQKSTGSRNITTGSTRTVRYSYQNVTTSGFRIYYKSDIDSSTPSTFFYIALGV